MGTHLLRQCWAASGVLLNVFGQSLIFSYPSCLLPSLRADDSPIKLDADMGSWIASCVGATMVIGICGTSLLLELCGRRATHALIILPAVTSWLLIYFSSNVTMILFGRLLAGITVGLAFIAGSVVIGEYTSPEYRGLFLNLKTVSLSLGSILMHAIGNRLHWRIVALISMVPFIASFCITCTLPESPSWLVRRNRFKDSEEAFFWLRGNGEESIKELSALIKTQKKRIINLPKKLDFTVKISIFLKKFYRKDFLKPIGIILFSFSLLDACGRHFFPAYVLDIVGEIVTDNSQTLLFTLGLDAITLISASFSSVLVKLLHRRTLLFCSGILSCILLLTMSLYLYLISQGILSKDPWKLLVMLVAFFVFSNLGCTAIPIVLFGEVFPLPHRESLTAIAGSITACTFFAALKTTPMMLETIKVSGTFAVLAAVIAVSLVYLYFTLPETRNRTLQEIEDYFNFGKFADCHNYEVECNVFIQMPNDNNLNLN